jgi:hypothetical protein
MTEWTHFQLGDLILQREVPTYLARPPVLGRPDATLGTVTAPHEHFTFSACYLFQVAGSSGGDSPNILTQCDAMN